MQDPSPGRSQRGRDFESLSFSSPIVQQALRVGAKGLVTGHGRVLLIQEQRADGSSFWTIPGGGVEAYESFPECLRREIEEEIQCRSTVGDAVDAYVYSHTTRPTTTVYTVFDVALHADPAPNGDERIVDHAWRKPTNLPTTTLDPVKHVVESAVASTERSREKTY